MNDPRTVVEITAGGEDAIGRPAFDVETILGAASVGAARVVVLTMRRKKMLLGSEGETAWQNVATKSFPIAFSPS
jgi:hypothetical protein